MQVVVGRVKLTLSDTDVLGVGGEACVYRSGSVAVKIYHAPATGLSAKERDAARQAVERKLAKVQSFPGPVPPELVAPLEMVTDPKGRSIGFTMPLIGGTEPMGRLVSRRWREGVVPNERVVALFTRLAGALGRVHATGIVCGDLNDANVLFRDTDVWLIDADSVQFGSHPCVVATEKYLDPRLYGKDLASGPLFDATHDWYSFAVMLFSSLLYVHPYGGIHPALPTMLRRAEASVSVLQRGVTYPKAAVPFSILPDDVLHWFERVFDHGLREAMPQALLAMRFTRCTCGHEHARTRCPACSAPGAAAARAAVISHGRCRAQRVFATTGRILAVALQGALHYVYECDGVVQRENRERVMEQALAPGMRFAIQGPTTWVGMGDQLVRIQGESMTGRYATGTMENEPVFDATSANCFRLEHENLMDSREGTRHGKVFPGQTWFRCGERLGFGFWRAGQHLHHFLFRTDRPGLTDVALPVLPGRLCDATAAFDEKHVLWIRTVEERGVMTRSLDLIDDTGRVLASITGHPEKVRMLASSHGKAVSQGRVLCATDSGLLALKVDGGTLVESTLFADSEPFVESGATILPGPGGSVYVVTTKEITQLTLA